MGMAMEGPVYRLRKRRGDEAVTLTVLDDEDRHQVLGAVRFEDLDAVRRCAEVLLEIANDPPQFPGWDLSLHGD